jgi:TRAP-type C4-dicarboxylate transport system permease small subunit
MLIFPVIYHDKDFIRMHLVEEFIGRRFSKYINIFADCLVLAFVVYLLYLGLTLSLGQFNILSRGLGIPRVYVTIPLSIGAALSLPIGLDIFLQDLRGIITGNEAIKP